MKMDSRIFHIKFCILWLFCTVSTMAFGQTGYLSISTDFYTTPGTFIVLNNTNLAYSGAAEFPGDGTFVFSGTDSVTVSNTAGAVSLPGMELENTGGLTLEDGDLYIRENLDFDGSILFAEAQTVIFEVGSTTTGASNGGFVDGPVQKIGNTNFTFPVGDVKGDTLPLYQPVRIFGHTGSITIEARYFAENIRDTLTFNNNIIGGCDYWSVERISGDSSAYVGLAYENSNSGYCNDVNEPSTLTFSVWNSLDWDPIFSTAMAGEVSSDQTIGSHLGSIFGIYVLTSGSQLNILPITLLHFAAAVTPEKLVRTDWRTATEINNDYFTVERSGDGATFQTVGHVSGAGNSTSALDYVFVDDAPLMGVSYYRLRQTDFDGTFTFSNIRPVEIKDGSDFSLDAAYRSDLGLQLSYRAVAPYLTVEIFDLAGKRIFGDLIDNYEGQSVIYPNLARGTYLVRLSNGRDFAAGKFFW